MAKFDIVAKEKKYFIESQCKAGFNQYEGCNKVRGRLYVQLSIKGSTELLSKSMDKTLKL